MPEYFPALRKEVELIVEDTDAGLMVASPNFLQAYDRLISPSVANAKFLTPGGGIRGYTNNNAAGSTLWPTTGRVDFPATPVTMYAVSDSANDDVAGTGAQRLRINYMAAGGNPATQFVDLDGATPVAFPTNVYRLLDIFVARVGSGGKNAGTIKIQNNGASATYGVIAPGDNMENAGRFTVPTGYRFVATGIAGNNNAVTLCFISVFSTMNPSTGDVGSLSYEIRREKIAVAGYEMKFGQPIVFPAMADIELAITPAAAMSASAVLKGALEAV